MSTKQETPPSHSSKKTKTMRKRKRSEHESQLQRFNSLRWKSSLSVEKDDDPFSSVLDGSGELDGGFSLLEEIDEGEYCLPIPISGKGVDVDEVTDEVILSGESNKKEKKKELKAKKKKNKKIVAKVTHKKEESFTVSNDEDEEAEELVDTTEVPTEFGAWNELRLHPLLMKSIYKLGFKEPTPIQKACIPAAAHRGKDVIGAAETGSGKTLAFGLPILQRLLEEREKVSKIVEEKEGRQERFLRALIITPTRELALQVTEHIKNASNGIYIRVVPIVGGISAEKQERLLKARPEIIVGTPGRLWELMSGGKTHLVELHSLSFFVLDEADRMIENGHFRELQSIIDMLPVRNDSTDGQSQNGTVVTVKRRQTFVFSATIALSADFRKKLKRRSLNSKPSTTEALNSIENLSERAGMRDNVAVVDLTSASVMAHNLEESFIECREEDKDAYLYYILNVHGQGSTLVFCTSIAALRHISAILRVLGTNVWTLHAQMQQRARLKAIDRFRASDNGILIATDVAARGLDIPCVRTVIHYQLPHSAEVYVHRSGRTARASADGCSIALISTNDTSKFVSLCKSFSKESVRKFPLESSYMPEVMKRLSLARQIDKISRKDTQEKTKKSWVERTAESLGLVVESEDSEDERVNNHKQKRVSSMQLKNLQQELNALLSRPLQPKTFSRRYLAGAGMSSLLQHQIEELAKQKLGDSKNTEDTKRRKLMVIGQDCIEPLLALRNAATEVMDMKETGEKRRNTETLRRKRKEEKNRVRDQRRNQKKQLK